MCGVGDDNFDSFDAAIREILCTVGTVDYTSTPLGRATQTQKGEELTTTSIPVKENEGVLAEASRRRTFAIIAHPDAGKSTLTEALALHAHVISEAGVTHGKANRKSTVSDWMEMEKDRGISISSTALQFAFDGRVINLVDTPGHADFSEDTYRVLAAVDCAVMLIDAAKGLEPQTLKLFDVCRRGNIPVITVINKWDRPGLDPLELVDQIHQRIGLRPTPLTWPVGIAGDFRGVLDRASGDFIKFTRTAGGATRAPEERIPADQAHSEGPAWQVAVEEHELLSADGSDHDRATFLAGETTPVLFSAATLNFGVGQLLRTLVDIAPSPADRITRDGTTRPLASPFSAFVFKVQAGMDSSHRDHLAFARVCSGTFRRGMVVTHQRTERPFATKYAQSVFGRERTTADTAYPGDVIGLVNASALGIGDTLYVDEPVEFPPIPRFAPEHFSVIRARDSGRHKQFRRGIEQLDQEGIVQVLRSELRGDQAPVLAAVGPMQFEVVQHRMEHEFGATTSQERLPYTVARAIAVENTRLVDQHPGAEAMTRSDGATLALFTDRWRLRTLEMKNPQVSFVSLAAGSD